jgi:hypothetical protein
MWLLVVGGVSQERVHMVHKVVQKAMATVLQSNFSGLYAWIHAQQVVFVARQLDWYYGSGSGL